MKDAELKIAVLSGDGIGPEVMQQALKVLKQIEKKSNLSVKLNTALIGGVAIDATGTALPEATVQVCQHSDAVLFGSVGGPKWDSLPAAQQPERAALLPLRKKFQLCANLRPVIFFDALKQISPLKEHIISKKLDLMVVRELTGGIYFSEPKGVEQNTGFDTMRYHRHEVERIAHLAFSIASSRKGRVMSIDKANVLSTMVFWRKVVSEVAVHYPDVELAHMYVDNAAMQLVLNPSQFDVLLCSNLFGDILSDEAAVLVGSLGMLASASIRIDEASVTSDLSLPRRRFGLFEPIGGSAPDIAGKDIANPIAQILSLALMLKYSFGLDGEYQCIVQAIQQVLQQGYRTRDIMGGSSDTPSTTDASQSTKEIGTEEMGSCIVKELNLL